jgi:hypothetical protein
LVKASVETTRKDRFVGVGRGDLAVDERRKVEERNMYSAGTNTRATTERSNGIERLRFSQEAVTFN